MKSVLFAMLWAISTLAHAGDMAIQPPQPFPTLETLVGKADLVLRCRAETVRGKRNWRVIEALKGEYRPRMFDEEIAGLLGWTGTITLAHPSRHAAPAHTEEIVFLRLLHIHTDDGKAHERYDAYEAFPVMADKIVYPKTTLWGHVPDTVEREYTVAEFSAAVRAIK
ncbi:MAG TPA: hypothetical protein VGO11_12010 [Chthoniobacteraceae bacterium]|jgi:hypothetical protein|nr:hypothetical protein [Chthoniobacteraceae bacterium]